MWKKSRGFPHQVLLGCSALLSVLRAHHHLALVRLLLRCYLYVFYHYLLPNSALFVEFSLLDIRLYESLGFSLVLDRLFYFSVIVCILSFYYLFLSGVVSTLVYRQRLANLIKSALVALTKLGISSLKYSSI